MKFDKKTIFVQTAFICVFFILSVQTSANIPALIKGKVVKFDKKTVTLSQKSGGVHVGVPRSSIPKNIKIKTGMMIQAKLDGASVVKQMKEHAEAAKKQKAEEEKARRLAAKADKDIATQNKLKVVKFK